MNKNLDLDLSLKFLSLFHKSVKLYFYISTLTKKKKN